MTLFSSYRCFDGHEEIKICHDPENGLDCVIVFHKKKKGYPSIGSTTIASFSSIDDMINQALFKSRYNTFRLAFSDLPYGGANALINFSGNFIEKTKLLHSYSSILRETSNFKTFAGKGLSYSELRHLSRSTKNIVGLESNFTDGSAYGIFQALRGIGIIEIENPSIVFHGLSHQATALMNYLTYVPITIYFSEEDPLIASTFSNLYPEAIRIKTTESHLIKSDCLLIFTPLSISNEELIQTSACKHICCVDPTDINKADIESLYKKGILFFPSFVINSAEMFFPGFEIEQNGGFFNKDHVFKSIESVYKKLKYIKLHSDMLNISPYQIALQMAQDKLDQEYIDENQLELALNIEPIPII